MSKNLTCPFLLPQEASPWWTATQVLGWWRPRPPPQPLTRSVTLTGWTRAARNTRGRETWRLICDRTSTWWNRRRGSPWYYRARWVKQTRSGEINAVLSIISSSDSRLLDTAGLQTSHDDSTIFPINDVCVTGLIPQSSTLKSPLCSGKALMCSNPEEKTERALSYHLCTCQCWWWNNSHLFMTSHGHNLNYSLHSFAMWMWNVRAYLISSCL